MVEYFTPLLIFFYARAVYRTMVPMCPLLNFSDVFCPFLILVPVDKSVDNFSRTKQMFILDGRMSFPLLRARLAYCIGELIRLGGH